MNNRAQRTGLAAAVALALTGAGGAPTVASPAATSQDFGPIVITGVPHAPKAPAKPTQKVVPLATIETQLAAGATASISSRMQAYSGAPGSRQMRAPVSAAGAAGRGAIPAYWSQCYFMAWSSPTTAER